MTKLDSPQDTLQGYFDDLLLDPGEQPVAPAPRKLPKQQPKPMTAVPQTRFAEPTEQPVRKNRLAKLLQTVHSEPQTDTRPQEETVRPLPKVGENGSSGEVAVVTPKVTEQAVTEPVAKAVVSPAEVVRETAPKVESGVVVEETPPAGIAAEPTVAVERDYGIEGLAWLENGRPQWAQQRFEVLLFKVSGLTLAVPLIALGQIQPLTDELTPIFGQADWFMGLQPTPVGKIRTVNTAKFVMPERYDERFVETAQYVISIDGLPWGLAVDSVTQPITLDPEEVKWRSERSKRAWLAGTVREHMCALLDIPMMGKMLMETDKNLQAAAS